MTTAEAYEILGKRAEELVRNEDVVQSKMVAIAKIEGKEAAEKFLYSLAIATLCVTPEEFEEYSKKHSE